MTSQPCSRRRSAATDESTPPLMPTTIRAAIEEAGARATPQAPLAWVRLEPEELLDGVKGSPRMVADLIIWPGAERRILGYTDGHVRAFYGP